MLSLLLLIYWMFSPSVAMRKTFGIFTAVLMVQSGDEADGEERRQRI
jgi:hypothetical protein